MSHRILYLKNIIFCKSLLQIIFGSQTIKYPFPNLAAAFPGLYIMSKLSNALQLSIELLLCQFPMSFREWSVVSWQSKDKMFLFFVAVNLPVRSLCSSWNHLSAQDKGHISSCMFCQYPGVNRDTKKTYSQKLTFGPRGLSAKADSSKPYNLDLILKTHVVGGKTPASCPLISNPALWRVHTHIHTQ